MARTVGKSRFFIGIGIFLFMVGFVAIFHSTQQQLDDLRMVGLRCEQQQAIVNAQMESEVGKVARLEHSLAAEQQVNRRAQSELQQKMRSEKDLKEKALLDSNVRFSSLQQHYKMLKSEHKDLKDECADTRQKHIDELDRYQGKIKSLQSQITQIQQKGTDEVEQWKLKYVQLEIKMRDLEASWDKKSLSGNDEPLTNNLLQYKNYKLNEELEEIKRRCSTSHSDGINSGALSTSTRAVNRGAEILAKPVQDNNSKQNVLKEPGRVKVSSSTATLDKAELSSKPGKMAAPIAVIPTIVQQSSVAQKPATSQRSRKLPEGVVPIPESMNELVHSDLGGFDRPGQEASNLLQNGNEVDTGAHEVNDFNIIEDRNHHDHVMIDDEKVNLIDNNAAEVGGDKDKHKADEDFDLESINRDLQLNREDKEKKKKQADTDKFHEEVAGDQGFDEHLEEQVEEGEDDDEYANFAARHQGQEAVRN